MAKINDSIAKVKKALLGRLTKESSKEQIDFVNGLVSELDAIDGEANTIIQDKIDITEKYVKAISGEGSTENVNDGADGEATTPKTLEQCLKEELEKSQK